MVSHTTVSFRPSEDIFRHPNCVLESVEFQGGEIELHVVHYERNIRNTESDVGKDVAWDEGEHPK
jgi:predicted transposase YdaD